jgi:hypothetical protein
MPILKKTPARPAAPATDKEDNIPMKHGTGGKPVKRDAFAERFEQTEAAAKGTYVPPPPGTYNALITEAQYEEEDPMERAYFEATIVDHKELQGKTMRIYYGFVSEDGSEGSGMPYFKSNLSMLGYERLASKEECKEVLQQIAEEQPWIIIDVKKRGKYTNVYLSSVPEDQANKPSL